MIFLPSLIMSNVSLLHIYCDSCQFWRSLIFSVNTWTRRKNRSKTRMNTISCGKRFIYNSQKLLKSLSMNVNSILFPQNVWSIWLSIKLYLCDGLMGNFLSWRLFTEALIMSSQSNHGMRSVTTKDLHLQSFNLRMEEYLEAILQKIGWKEMKKNMISSQKMIKLGCFLLIIKPNSKLNQIIKNMR
jgi:hypothetical protein